MFERMAYPWIPGVKFKGHPCGCVVEIAALEQVLLKVLYFPPPPPPIITPLMFHSFVQPSMAKSKPEEPVRTLLWSQFVLPLQFSTWPDTEDVRFMFSCVLSPKAYNVQIRCSCHIHISSESITK
jgi:hypothetical protein